MNNGNLIERPPSAPRYHSAVMVRGASGEPQMKNVTEMKNVNHCILRCITSINVSRQGILLLSETAYEYFDLRATKKCIYIYVIYIFLLY